MKIKILLPILLTLALFTTGYAQMLDKAKLDQFFDRGKGSSLKMSKLAEIEQAADSLSPEQKQEVICSLLRAAGHPALGSLTGASYLPNGRIGPMCGEIGLLVIPTLGIRRDM